MSQPLGEWAGHTAELRAAFEGLEGRGAPDLMAVTLALAGEMAALVGQPLFHIRMDLDSGRLCSVLIDICAESNEARFIGMNDFHRLARISSIFIKFAFLDLTGGYKNKRFRH
jgi:hypothetical protein